MKARGGVNPISVLLLLAIGAGIWAAITFIPAYWDNLTVREVAHSAATRYPTSGEDGVAAALLERLNDLTMEGTVGWHFDVDEDGYEQKVPGLAVDPDNVQVSYDEEKRVVTVRVAYDRTVELKPSDERRVLHFVVEEQTKMP